jgi:hypothetical protein
MTKKFPDFAGNPDTVLTTPAPTDQVLIWDNSEPLDINKVKVITFQNLVNLAAQSAIQALVSSQAAGDVFYATSATALARLAKGTANQILKMNAGATAIEWGTATGKVCIAKNSGSQTFTTSAGFAATVVNLGAEDEDLPGWHSTITNNSRVTVDEDGLYLIVGRISWSGAGIEGCDLKVELKIDGTAVAIDSKKGISASFSTQNTAIKIIRLTNGQYAELFAAQNSGGNLSLNSAYLEVLRVG